ncbi:MAG: ABC transporter substrate-binding protein [Rhizobiales bacterium]|nr:ABC transporter substrate-binding protein [Hyphomicrobiales bacterium]
MAGLLVRPFGRRKFVGLFLASVVAGLADYPAIARAAVDPAETYVSNIADEVMKLANSGLSGNTLRGRFASLLNRYINLRGIANYALGPYQSKLPLGKRDEFYRLVNNYAAALFVYYVKDFQGSELEIISNTKQGSFTVIQSAIKQTGGGREQVRWRLASSGGGFRVADVNVKGVWLTISMKDRFSRVLNKSNGDFGALFEELRTADTW